jgi:hypothetical protein
VQRYIGVCVRVGGDSWEERLLLLLLLLPVVAVMCCCCRDWCSLLQPVFGLL